MILFFSLSFSPFLPFLSKFSRLFPCRSDQGHSLANASKAANIFRVVQPRANKMKPWSRRAREAPTAHGMKRERSVYGRNQGSQANSDRPVRDRRRASATCNTAGETWRVANVPRDTLAHDVSNNSPVYQQSGHHRQQTSPTSFRSSRRCVLLVAATTALSRGEEDNGAGSHSWRGVKRCRSRP